MREWKIRREGFVGAAEALAEAADEAAAVFVFGNAVAVVEAGKLEVELLETAEVG